jgi:hypothetical protein
MASEAEVLKVYGVVVIFEVVALMVDVSTP